MAFEQCRGRGGLHRMDGEVLPLRSLGWIPGQVEVKAGEDVILVVGILLHEVVREVGASDSSPILRIQPCLHVYRVFRKIDVHISDGLILWHVCAGRGSRKVQDSAHLLIGIHDGFVRFAEEGFASTRVYLPTGIPVSGLRAGRQGVVCDLIRRADQLIGDGASLEDQAARFGGMIDHELPGDELEPLELLGVCVALEN